MTSPLLVITGPTAAGKSAIAMRLAIEHGLTIVSADSRQIYRGFDIGTAKPSLDDRRRVQHVGLDIIDPTDRYSAHAFARDVMAKSVGIRDDTLADVANASVGAPRRPIVVGGTGFYIRALIEPLHGSPTLDAANRASIESWMATLDAAEVERWSRRLDPGRSHLGRTQRLRSIETALLAGVRLGDVHARTPDMTPPVRAARYLVIDPGVPLAERMAQRVRDMVRAGWFDEVERLMRSIPPDAPAWNACGYGTIRSALAGQLSRDAAVEHIIIETRQYAKRQRTWFRTQLRGGPVTRLNPDAPDAYAQVAAWYEGLDAGTTGADR